LNELIMNLNNGVLDKQFPIDWERYQDTMMLKRPEGLKLLKIQTIKVYNIWFCDNLIFIGMNNIKYDTLIKETNLLIKQMRESFSIVQEGEGIDNLFDELNQSLPKITMLPNNTINANKYKEHEIVDALRSVGYEYKKPIGVKLHFFNKKTSVSVYVSQNTRYITLQP